MAGKAKAMVIMMFLRRRSIFIKHQIVVERSMYKRSVIPLL